MLENILEIEHLTKNYPGVVALDDVSLQIRRGEIHAIVGENGAGKSTLIKAITGALQPDSGVIRFDGHEYARLDPATAVRAGIGAVYQEFNLVPQLSAAENIFLGNYCGGRLTVSFREMNRRAAEAMREIGVDIPPRQAVESMTVGHQQIVEITRSLVRNMKLLIMDEPTAPLTNNEVEQLFRIVRLLKSQGMTVIFISHRIEEIFELADRVSVFRDGKYVITKDTAEAERQELIRYMVGHEVTGAFPPRVTPVSDEAVLSLENLTGNGVHDISFTLHKGEILGLAGLLGCGRTQTMQMVFGVARPKSGAIVLHGQRVNIKSPSDALQKSIGLIPEDRKRQGAFLEMTIMWNICISALKRVSNGALLNKKKERGLAKAYIDLLRIRTPGMTQAVGYLSGGNQQKVVVSKVLATNADILILDEPTRGIDVGAKEEMYELIRQMSEAGKSIVLISSEMIELMGLADRLVILHEGRQTGTLERGEFDQERILTLASGVAV